MHEAWKGHKYELHSYFKEIGGEEDPIKAKNECPEEVSKEDWDYLCDLWIDPKYLVMYKLLKCIFNILILREYSL